MDRCLTVNHQREKSNTKASYLESVIRLIAGHEFRTPLNGIVGFAELLNDKRVAITKEEQFDYVKYILESAKRLDNLSDRLRIWYNLTQNTRHSEDTCLLTANRIEEALIKQASKFIEKTELFRFSAYGTDWRIKGELYWVSLLLDELIDNAFKFSAADGIVSVAVTDTEKTVEVTVTNKTNYANAAMMNKYLAFKQFGREKMEQQGLGIGVEIARLSLKKYHGFLVYKNQTRKDFDLLTAKIIFRKSD